MASIVGGLPNFVKIWQFKGWKEIRSIRVNTAINGIVFSNDSRSIAGSFGGSGMKIWDLKTGREQASTKAASIMYDLQYQPGSWYIACGEANVVKIFNSRNLKLTQSLKGHDKEVWTICFSPDGKQLVSGGPDKTVRVWDLQASRLAQQLVGRLGPTWQPPRPVMRYAYPLAMCSEQNLLAIGHGNFVRLWDLNSRQELRLLNPPNVSYSDVSFSRDGRLLAAVCGDSTVRVFDMQTGKVIQQFAKFDRLGLVCFRSDGKSIAGAQKVRQPGQKEFAVKVWSLATGKELLHFPAHESQMLAIQYSPDGRHFATCSTNGSAKLWDAVTGRHRFTLEGHGQFVFDICFSPDSKILVSGGRDSTIRLWDVATGKEITVLSPQGTDRITSVSFNSDGTRLLAGLSNSVQLWDTKYHTHLLTLKAPNQPPFGNIARFTLDGRSVLSMSGRKLLLWNDGSEARTEK